MYNINNNDKNNVSPVDGAHVDHERSLDILVRPVSLLYFYLLLQVLFVYRRPGRFVCFKPNNLVVNIALNT